MIKLHWKSQKQYINFLRQEEIWTVIYKKTSKNWCDVLTPHTENLEQYQKEYRQAQQLFMSKIKLSKEELAQIEEEHIKPLKEFFKSIRKNKELRRLYRAVKRISDPQNTFFTFQRYGLNRTYDFCELSHGAYNLFLFLKRILALWCEYDPYLEASYPIEKLEYSISSFYRPLGIYAKIEKRSMD